MTTFVIYSNVLQKLFFVPLFPLKTLNISGMIWSKFAIHVLTNKLYNKETNEQNKSIAELQGLGRIRT